MGGGVTCWVYRSARRDGTYLYVCEQGRFDPVPQALLARLGRLDPVMRLELHPGRRLARADVAQVMADLRERGWYLQLPPVDGSGSEAAH